MTLAMSGATQSDSGLASGLVNTTTQVGGAIGLAVLATVAAERTDTLEAAGESTNSALNAGFHLAYLIGQVRRHSDDELSALLAPREGAPA
jgi:hypothetical protein